MSEIVMLIIKPFPLNPVKAIAVNLMIMKMKNCGREK